MLLKAPNRNAASGDPQAKSTRSKQRGDFQRKQTYLQIADKSPLTVAIGKEAFYHQLEQPLVEAYDYAAGVMVKNMLARDAEEGIGAFIEKREPKWTGE